MSRNHVRHNNCMFEYDDIVQQARMGGPNEIVFTNVTMNVPNGGFFSAPEVPRTFFLRVADEIYRSVPEALRSVSPAAASAAASSAAASSVVWKAWPTAESDDDDRAAAVFDIQRTWMDRALVVSERLRALGLKWVCDDSGRRPRARLVLDELVAEVMDFGAVAFWRLRTDGFHVKLGDNKYTQDLWDGGSEATFDLALIAAGEALVTEMDARAGSAVKQLDGST